MGEKSLTHAFVFTKLAGGARTEVARGSMTVVSVALDHLVVGGDAALGVLFGPVQLALHHHRLSPVERF